MPNNPCDRSISSHIAAIGTIIESLNEILIDYRSGLSSLAEGSLIGTGSGSSVYPRGSLIVLLDFSTDPLGFWTYPWGSWIYPWGFRICCVTYPWIFSFCDHGIETWIFSSCLEIWSEISICICRDSLSRRISRLRHGRGGDRGRDERIERPEREEVDRPTCDRLIRP